MYNNVKIMPSIYVEFSVNPVTFTQANENLNPVIKNRKNS